MTLVKFSGTTISQKNISKPLSQQIKPVKANNKILSVHKFFLNNLHLFKSKSSSLPGPFSLFNQKPAKVNLPTIKIAQPSDLIDNISAIGNVKQPLNPLQDFVKSFSAAPKPAASYQFSAEVLELISENKEFKTLRLKKPNDWNFLPGQYLEIRAENSSATKPAILAIASGIGDDYIEITAKPNPNPNHANHCLNSIAGEYLTITGPLGTNFPIDAITADTPVLILGGGSGLTALKSIMESLPFGTDANLIYSSKNVEGLIYQEEIEKWKSQGHTITLTQEKADGFAEGRISEHLKNTEIKPNTLVFLCGPKELVLETARMLAEMGVPRESIFGSLPATAKDGGPIYRGDHPAMIIHDIA